jgi:hypothetical protein
MNLCIDCYPTQKEAFLTEAEVSQHLQVYGKNIYTVIWQNNNCKFYPRAYEIPSWDFKQAYSTKHIIILCGIGFKFNLKAIGCPVTVMPLFPWWTPYCLTAQYHSIQDPVVGMATDVFSLPAVWIATTGIIKAIQQGGSLLVGVRWISLFPVIKMCSVFSYWVLLCSYGGWPMTMANSLCCFRDLCGYLDQ